MNKHLAEVVDENSYLRAMNKKRTALQRELVEALKHLMYRFECAPSCAKLLNDLIARAEKTL